MSTTHAWWPKSVGMVIGEATVTGVLTAVSAWAGAARPRMAAVSPLATTAANPNLFIWGAFFFLYSVVFEPWRDVAVRRQCRPVMMVPLRRPTVYNTQLSALIPGGRI